MATTRFPNPITNLYNPSAWAFVDVAETGAVGNFIDFPEAQDEPITFPNTILTDTITGTTNATAMTIGGTTDVGSITIGSTLNAGDKLVLGSAASTTTIAGTLKTPSITSTGNMTIAPPTLSTMTIANAAQTRISIGAGVRTGAGAGNGITHVYSGANGALITNNVTLNNGDQNQSSTFIQCGPGTSGTRSNGNVEIKTGIFNTGEIRLGQFTSDSNKTTTVIKGDVNLVTLKGTEVSTAMTIGSNITTGSIVIGSALQAGDNLTLGSSACATTVNGTLKSDSIAGSLSSSTMTIGNNITSGNINIGTSISSGDHILIGSSTAGSRVVVDGALVSNKMEGYVSNSAMGIGNNITDGSITIGSAQTGNMLLGSTSSITQVQGTFVSNSLNGKSATANMTIASTATSSTLTVGSNMTGSGGILLGSSSSNTTLNGTVKTNTLMPITAGGTITINSTGNGNTTIGTSGGTGSITLNRQPTIGYGITAQSIASLDTIGGRYERRLGFGNHTINTTAVALCSMNGLPVGLYSLVPYVFIPAGTASNLEVLLVRSNAVINDGQTTGLTVINDGSETYTYASATQVNSVNSAWIYEVAASPNNNIAFTVKGSVALATSSVYIFKIIRIA